MVYHQEDRYMPHEPFTQDTNLKITTSPLSADFIDEFLRTKRNGELAGIGKAAVAAAQNYSINTSYIVAHAALETGWGAARIAREKNNLFGWSAFDASPYSSARGFPNRETCIDFVMGRINELYLTPSGRYFRRAPCLGQGGDREYGMNANYASDPGWGAKIARIADTMEQAFIRTAPASDLPVVLAATEAALPSVADMIARARSAVGRRTKYQLGEGGTRPAAELPGAPSKGCDCSGYVCWCLGIARQTDHNLYVHFNGGWINTDAIVHDADANTGFFYKIESPKVGTIIVYPSKRPSRKYGHVGIVTEVKQGKMS
jgi:cell wall-associated NlpC family hydrolase